MKTQVSQRQVRALSFAAAPWIAAALFLVSTVVSAPPAFAAGLTVKGGAVTVTSQNLANFTLGGPFFTVTGSVFSEGGYDIYCDPCSPLLQISLRATSLDFSLSGKGSGRLVLGSGIKGAFPILAWTAISATLSTYININGPVIPLTGPGFYVGPMTYALAMCGRNVTTSLNTIAPHCDVTLPFQTGTGSVVVEIAKDPITGNLRTVSATYLFR